MPITAWLCPRCNREVPLDHFATSECGQTTCHPDMANAILKGRSEHYAQGVVEVSHALGCVRNYAIQHSEPYSVDPLSMNALETGNAWHSHMERGSADPSNTEVQLKGVIAGVTVVGKTDRLRPPDLIEDHKHKSDFSAKYVKDEADLTHMAQLSIYAELCQQQLGWTPKHGIIWYHFSMAGEKGIIPKRFRIMPIEAVLELKPHDGQYTVGELLVMAQHVFGEGGRWQDLPLAGTTMMFGQRDMCAYCGVRSVCLTQHQSAPF